MRLYSFALCGALAAIGMPAPAQSHKDVFLLGEGDASTLHRWEAPRGQYQALPRWTPASGEQPPLPIAKAVELGKVWIRKRYADVKHFEVTSVALMRAGCCVAADERWFYRLQFEPVVGGQRMFGGRFVAVVLLDGTVVDPKAEKTPSR